MITPTAAVETTIRSVLKSVPMWPLVVVLQQLELFIEESHGANDGYTKNGCEYKFSKHSYLLGSVSVLGQ